MTMPNPLAKDEFRAEPLIAPLPEAHLSLVNPSTGLANDYLNVFNEILLVLEFLPSMPEMTDEALAWQPRGYCEYFETSAIPGARQALNAYERVDPATRENFEAVLGRLTEIVVQAQQTLAEESGRPEYPDSIAKSCEETAEAMRAGLSYVSRLINEGLAPNQRASRRGKQSTKNGI
ncbi:hypothetical protein [Rhodoblastus sp.]|uniref:hypothetical protein n=1 Tax=Rhodoblastus sp. TaxID=1962975 RepID=UPI003F9CF77E